MRLLARGRLEMPRDAAPGLFILSDGKLNGKRTARKVRLLADLFSTYEKNLPRGTKEEGTLQREQTHIKHSKRHFGASTVAQAISVSHVHPSI